MYQEKVKVRLVGGSLYVRLSSFVKKMIDLKHGDIVTVRYDGKKIIIEKEM